jgi:nitrogen fixation NifU-like protein
VIVDHNRHPRNFGHLDHPTHHADGFNPLCGDKISIDLEVRDGVIQQIKFEGKGCAISTASASLMTENLTGKSLTEAETLFHAFHDLITKEDVSHMDKLGKLAVLAGVKDYPARIKCATLAWHALHAAMLKESQLVSTE